MRVNHTDRPVLSVCTQALASANSSALKYLVFSKVLQGWRMIADSLRSTIFRCIYTSRFLWNQYTSSATGDLHGDTEEPASPASQCEFGSVGFSRPHCSWDNLCKETRMAFLNVL